eukprot:TRINITY_DN10588_c0_g1_i1.p2 TRINITY_DN10588_c0_g1~~TRINITY_DN10588_c0_g1_i1.p2  ORF type:complete len:150 (-),score=41.37 TRINITY_DN10588_c0_g1_i1:297-746(-)
MDTLSDEEYARKLQAALFAEDGIDPAVLKEGKNLHLTNVQPREMVIRLPEEQRKFNPSLFGAMIQKGFERLYLDQQFSDLVIILRDEKEDFSEKIFAHKMVLSVWSSIFRSVIQEKEKEGKKKSTKKTKKKKTWIWEYRKYRKYWSRVS